MAVDLPRFVWNHMSPVRLHSSSGSRKNVPHEDPVFRSLHPAVPVWNRSSPAASLRAAPARAVTGDEYSTRSLRTGLSSVHVGNASQILGAALLI